MICYWFSQYGNVFITKKAPLLRGFCACRCTKTEPCTAKPCFCSVMRSVVPLPLGKSPCRAVRLLLFPAPAAARPLLQIRRGVPPACQWGLGSTSHARAHPFADIVSLVTHLLVVLPKKPRQHRQYHHLNHAQYQLQCFHLVHMRRMCYTLCKKGRGLFAPFPLSG